MTTNLFVDKPAWAGAYTDVDSARVPKIAGGLVRFGIRFECVPLVTKEVQSRFYIAVAAIPTASRVFNATEYECLLESLVGETQAAEVPLCHESTVSDLSLRPAR